MILFFCANNYENLPFSLIILTLFTLSYSFKTHLLFWLSADCELFSWLEVLLVDFLCSCLTSSLAFLLGGAFTQAKSSSVTAKRQNSEICWQWEKTDSVYVTYGYYQIPWKCEWTLNGKVVQVNQDINSSVATAKLFILVMYFILTVAKHLFKFLTHTLY